MTDVQVRTLVIVTGAILFAVVAFVFWRAQSAGKKNRHLNEHKQLQQEQQKALQDYEQSIRSLLEEIEKESCDTETALAISEQCRQYIGGTLSGQPIVDALLAYKHKECDDRGIQLEMEMTAFPLEGFSGEEYVGILGNLLDNAMEAAERTTKPWVRLKSFKASGQWILEVTNSKPIDEAPLAGNMETIKEDKKNHGLGVKIVKRIVKKYRGVVNYRDYEDSFEVMIAIPLAEIEGRNTGNVECCNL